jgi:tRNA(Ile2)-agmatinylcytidine synthase
LKKKLHIGFDDTDSLKGSCTTHLASVIVTEIFDQVSFLDIPNLIRLNPNIPYKTRGNGAVALRVSGEKADLENCKEIVISFTKKLARVEDENTNPGIVFLKGDVPSNVKKFSLRAMWDVIAIKEVETFQEQKGIELIKFGNGRGRIGSLGAIGNELYDDFTYEHLTYREPKMYGSKRLVDEDSIIKADKLTPLTFNNVDYEYNSIMITPRGADPVFSGIRGETLEAVTEAWNLITPLETIAMQMTYRTNQHTNHHFVKRFLISEILPYKSVIVDGIVNEKPKYIEGSHLIFSIKDSTGKLDCAVYEPTKRFRGQLSKLENGDSVTICGGIRPSSEKHPMTINIESLKVNSLVDTYKLENPFCDNCGSRLKSAGKNKGYKCFKCSSIYRDKKPTKTKLKRDIELKVYLPPIIAQRHLAKPLGRNIDSNKKKPALNVISNYLKKLVDYNKSCDNNY